MLFTDDLVFGEGVEDKNYVNFSVKWIEQAVVEIVKKDEDTKENLSGAVYGIYSDAACKKLITQMPETDKDGKPKVTILKTQDTVYLKEITAPTGYCYNATASNVKLVANKTSTVHVTDKEQLGNLTVYKVGEILTGAVSNAEGTTFQYESRKQKGAVYNVYAKEDIKTPMGKVVYKVGELVKEHLVTGKRF